MAGTAAAGAVSGDTPDPGDSCDPFLVLGATAITLNIAQPIVPLSANGSTFNACEALT